MSYYPAFLDLKDKNVLLFGAGQVALRKAKMLFGAGAHLTVVSREFSKPFLKFAKGSRMKLVHGSRIPKLTHVRLVVAATSDRKFNQKVYRACERKKIFVNVIDDPKHSSFIVPSVVKHGRLALAISTGGASPALAKMIRKKLQKQFGSQYASLLKEMAHDRLRTKRNLPAKERRNHFQKLAASQLKALSR
jgi:siroheme synthase-like protein